MNVYLQKLTKKFANVTAVNELTLHLEDKKLIGLLGPSGCGKSTTLFMLAGLLEPTEGKILFDEKDVTEVETERRGIGLVFQNYALYPHMTVMENITFPLINLKVKKEEAKKRAIEMAELVQIGDLLKRRPKELSGGQQQRVAIARALVKQPGLLLLDEPLSNLDARLRIETREEIRRIQKEVGITTVFVTHDQEEALSISDKIAVLDKGVLLQYDTPQEVYKNPANEFVAKFLGTPAIVMIEGTVTEGRLVCQGINLRENINMENRRVRIGIRPEAFYRKEDGFEVQVQRVEMTGKDLSVHFLLGQERMRAIFFSDERIAQGDILRIGIKQEQILLFDADSGSSLGHV